MNNNGLDESMIVCLTYLIEGVPVYKILTTKTKDTYVLYKLKNDKYVKTKYQAENPTELYKYFV